MTNFKILTLATLFSIFSFCDIGIAEVSPSPMRLTVSELPTVSLNPMNLLNQKEKSGPSGSGGGNLLMTKVLVSWTSLNTLAKVSEFRELKRVELRAISTSTIQIWIDGVQSKTTFDISEFLHLNEYESLRKISSLVSSGFESGDAFQKKLEGLISDYIQFPLLIGLESIDLERVSYQSDTELVVGSLRNCRDRLRMSANPRTGHIQFSFSSTGTCIPSSEEDRLEFNYNNFHRDFNCKNVSEGLLCSISDQSVRDLDATSCEIVRHNKNSGIKKQPKTVLIKHDQTISFESQWCLQGRSKDFVYRLNSEYRKSSIKPSVADESAVHSTTNRSKANAVEKNLTLAKKVLLQWLVETLNNKDYQDFSEFNLFRNELEFFLKALSEQDIEIDHKSQTPFFHMGYATWIESNEGKIRVRPRSFLNYLNHLTINDYVYWIAHELSHTYHHSLGEHSSAWNEEQNATYRGLGVLFLLNRKFNNSPFLKISTTPFSSFFSGCRDTLEVEEFDVKTKILKFNVSTLRGKCRHFSNGLLSFFKQSSKEAEQISFEMICVARNETYVCENRNLSQEMSLCPIYKEQTDSKSKVISSIQIDSDGSIQSEYFWCIDESTKRSTFANWQQHYYILEEIFHLSPYQNEVAERLNRGFGGGLYHLIRK